MNCYLGVQYDEVFGPYVGARFDEVFIGNIETKEGLPDYLHKLKTPRLGEQALDLYGRAIDPGYIRPLFVHRSEIDEYKQIMMQRLKR